MGDAADAALDGVTDPSTEPMDNASTLTLSMFAVPVADLERLRAAIARVEDCQAEAKAARLDLTEAQDALASIQKRIAAYGEGQTPLPLEG